MENMKCLMNWGQIQCFSTYRHQKWLVKQPTNHTQRLTESQNARPKEWTCGWSLERETRN